MITRCVVAAILGSVACGGGSPADHNDATNDAASDGTADLDAGTAVVVHTFRLGFPDGVEAQAPAFLAARDGDGPFRPLAVVAGAATLHLTSPRYTVAAVCALAAQTVRVQLIEATVADAADLEVGCVDDRPGTVTTTFTVNGLSNPKSEGSLAIGPSTCLVTTAGTCALPARAGSWDVVAARRNVVFSDQPADTVVVRRAVSVTTDSSTELDFDAEGVATVATNLMTSPVTADDVGAIATRYGSPGPSGSAVSLCDAQFASFGCSAIATTDLGASDIQVAVGRAFSNASGERVIKHYFRTPQTLLSLALPAALAAPAVTALASPFGVSTRVARLDGAATYDVAISQSDAASGTWTWEVIATAAAVCTADVELATPDLSGLAGWDPQWNLDPTRATTWTVTAGQSTAPVEATVFHRFTTPWFDGDPVEPVGTDVRQSIRTGSL